MSTTENLETQSNENASSIFIGITALINFALKRWWVFVLVGLLGGAIGYFYAKYQKPVFKSKLSFALDDGGNSGGIKGFAGLASQFGLSIGSSKDIFDGENIIEILKSRRMVERVLLSIDTIDNKPLRLIDYYFNITGKGNAGSRLSKVNFPLTQQRATFSYLQDSALKVAYLKMIGENIIARKPDRKLNIFEVNVISPDERFSKIFTDRLVSETNLFYTEIRTKKAKETLAVLENRVASMKGNLNSSISSRAAVQDANINPAFAAAQTPVLQQQSNIQVYGGAYGEMFKNLEIARFQYLNEVPLMQIIDPADYPMEKIKKGKLFTAIIVAALFEFLLVICFWFILVVKKIKPLKPQTS